MSSHNQSNFLPRDPENDASWVDVAIDFCIAPDTVYLNHGSFGIPAKQTRYVQRALCYQNQENPMDFYLRQADALFQDSKRRLAQFVGGDSENLIFVDNATYAMSLVASQFPLGPNDEVMTTDHEYVPVIRMWQQRCNQVGAKLNVVKLPEQIDSHDQIITALTTQVTDRTRLLVVSHITSPTALILPIQEICQIFSSAGIPICVDGPHAPAQIDLQLSQLKCAFYTASCHKWLSAPLGTGFLYVQPKWQECITPFVKGWGRLPPVEVKNWSEQFFWEGTRELSHFLAVPAAVDYLLNLGLPAFRQRTYFLARYIESALCDLFKTRTIAQRNQGHYGSMAHVPLPPGDWSGLQQTLRNEVGIEVMVNQFCGRWFLRVSCHLYTNTRQLDLLVKTLESLKIVGPCR
jgi:isopenicillin-N epimerase